MKYIVLVPDGASDYPLKELSGRTPLQATNIPHMDRLAREGLLGTVRTIPWGMSPGSDVANLSIMGYDPTRFYTGRGPLEAASLGVELKADEVAFRCNLVTVADGRLIDYSAGHITSEEARLLIEDLQKKLGSDNIRFYPGISYRHLLVLHNGAAQARCLPPHDIVGSQIEASFPSGQGSEELLGLMKASREILEAHTVNQERVREGKNPANMIWLWGQGKAPAMPTFREKYGLTGGVITAVDLIKGIGRYAGLRIVDVPGATGYFDTDYAAKAEYALKVIQEIDFVFVHVEAPDEAGHTRNLQAKMEALEKFDEKIVGYLLDSLEEQEEFRILLLPDHATPLEIATHVDDPVPFVIFDSTQPRSSTNSFDEVAAEKSNFHLSQGFKLMDFFITGKLS
jgi:2,3-bisphosphoglycerate-independent phosphoglycerate mutase